MKVRGGKRGKFERRTVHRQTYLVLHMYFWKTENGIVLVALLTISMSVFNATKSIEQNRIHYQVRIEQTTFSSGTAIYFRLQTNQPVGAIKLKTSKIFSSVALFQDVFG